MKNTIVTVVGNVGSGKSTAVPIIAEAIGANILFADNLFQTTNPFRENFLKNINRWAFTTELWMMVERIKLFNQYITENKNKRTVIDSGLLMSWVYTYGHFVNKIITKEEWQLYETIFNMAVQNIFKDSFVVF
jgi:deoxyadenosine/deoxycytidine kinase